MSTSNVSFPVWATGRRKESVARVRVTPGTGRLGVLTLPLRALAGTLDAHEQFEVFRAQTITIDVSSRHLRVAIDGEVAVLPTPLRFDLRHNALRVIVPAQEDVR